MTALTAPVGPGVTRSRRLLDLTWNAARQHRLALAGLAFVCAAFGLRLVLTGIPLHATYSEYLLHHCVTQRHPACGRLLSRMQASWVTSYSGMVLLPGLVGMFVGAPLVAHDFETGAYRFALAQGVSGRRQLAARLLVIGAIVAIGSCVLGVLSMWCLAPFHRIALGFDTGLSYWETDYFNITAVMLPAWALLDFCVGVLAGVVIKRTVAAMAAVLAWAVTVAVLSTGFAVLPPGHLTEDLLAVAPVSVPAVPLLSAESHAAGFPGAGLPGRFSEVNTYPQDCPGPRGSLQVTGWFTGPDGQRMQGTAVQAMLNQIPQPVATHRARLRSWLATHRIGYWIGVQPADRYWIFQAAAAFALIALAAAASVAAIRLFTRPT